MGAATHAPRGPQNQGWQAKTCSVCAVDWAVAHTRATDARATCAHWPAIPIDMLAQGFGRQELLRRIGEPAMAGLAQGSVVTRLAQESIATLTGMPGFDALPSHDQVCEALIRHCTDPQAQVLEYLKRDVANLALLNKDNHARNTAVQRDFNGHIALTPLYDFAPMYLHPDGIARRIR